MRRSSLATLLLAALLSGCFTYVPAEIGSVPPAEKVRLRLADAELGRLLAYADPERRTVSGQLLGVGADSVTIVVSSPASYQEVTLPRAAVLESQVRQVQVGRSVGLSAAAVGIVGLVAWKGLSGGGSGREPGQEGGTDETLIPLFDITVPGGFRLVFGGR